MNVTGYNEMSSVKKSIICAVCIALCYILPLLFHGIQNAGSIFCPMHIPVFICGLICGWHYGLLCGLAGPAISSALTGMPPIAYMPTMMVELAIYGVVAGLMMRYVRTKNTYVDLYLSLIVAMILGRIGAGIVRALIFTRGAYSIAMWVSGYLITCWPGVLIQFVFIPTIIFALMKAQLIPLRYPQQKLDMPRGQIEKW